MPHAPYCTPSRNTMEACIDLHGIMYETHSVCCGLAPMLHLALKCKHRGAASRLHAVAQLPLASLRVASCSSSTSTLLGGSCR